LRPKTSGAKHNDEKPFPSASCFETLMSDGSFSIFLAGDAIITAPWSHITDPDFEGLIDQMRQSDATILNLETVIHTFKGYAQADSGGTWLTSPPKIAQELAWAGVDMVSHANNHAFDYGSEGILLNWPAIRRQIP
jgi:poly-gamma-glutamate capsule biosynthesis protein CapA/YwtB (metallophosphatase superfamily)